MTTVRVHTKHCIVGKDRARMTFDVGVHEVPDELAEHWYMKAHSEPVAPAPAQAETSKPARKK